jgi:hypothetical protein
MVAHLPNDIGVVWAKGSHYANVYEGWDSPNNVDCFSFAFEKNKTSMLDFTESLAVYLGEQRMWVHTPDKYISFEHCGRPAYWESDQVYCSKCQEMLPDEI